MFKKYLYKISKYGICVRIESIDIVDNIILRKTAEMKVKLTLNIIVLNLLENEYYEGIISESDDDGILISFLGGVL